jgi:hypothetical protein
VELRRVLRRGTQRSSDSSRRCCWRILSSFLGPLCDISLPSPSPSKPPCRPRPDSVQFSVSPEEPQKASFPSRWNSLARPVCVDERPLAHALFMLMPCVSAAPSHGHRKQATRSIKCRLTIELAPTGKRAGLSVLHYQGALISAPCRARLPDFRYRNLQVIFLLWKQSCLALPGLAWPGHGRCVISCLRAFADRLGFLRG